MPRPALSLLILVRRRSLTLHPGTLLVKLGDRIQELRLETVDPFDRGRLGHGLKVSLPSFNHGQVSL
jgi:hypothetical protein